MRKTGRYTTTGLVENQYEPGSRRLVLRNLLGIKKKTDMNRYENAALRAAEAYFFEVFGKSHRFTASDLRRMHRVWLGKAYSWAGKDRQVSLSLSNFPFAKPRFVTELMATLERGPLHQYTPCRFDTEEQVVRSIAIVHAELILIHPFREGNGRIARMLATLMALQADLPPLDYTSIKGKGKKRYIAAIHAAMDEKNPLRYKPMEKIFSRIVSATLSRCRDRSK